MAAINVNNSYTDMKNLTPFKLCVLQNFPFIEADFDAVTNYQLLCKVVEYLNNVIDNNNKQNDNITQLEQNFITLYNYVKDYFDNLDVQNEINNKLDDMATSGELMQCVFKFMGYVTPEMYGAKGDGVTDDTLAVNNAINSNLIVVGAGTYKITSSIIINSTVDSNKNVFLNTIIADDNVEYAVNITGLLFDVKINNILTNNSGVHVGGDVITYNGRIECTYINSKKYAVVMGGNNSNSPVSQISYYGRYWTYGINCILFDLSNKWVGENAFYNIHMSVGNNSSAGYAFYADCSNNPMTGLRLYNISLEGCNGGFEILNTGANHSFESLNAFGLRTSEMCVRDNLPLIKLTGSGVVMGNIFADLIKDTSFDTNGYNNDICALLVHGRVNMSDGTVQTEVRLKNSSFTPDFIKEIITTDYGNITFRKNGNLVQLYINNLTNVKNNDLVISSLPKNFLPTETIAFYNESFESTKYIITVGASGVLRVSGISEETTTLHINNAITYFAK